MTTFRASDSGVISENRATAQYLHCSARHVDRSGVIVGAKCIATLSCESCFKR